LRGLGPLAGFMTGWTSFVTGFSGAMAASAIFSYRVNRFASAWLTGHFS
jgi:hypothetical protein